MYAVVIVFLNEKEERNIFSVEAISALFKGRRWHFKTQLRELFVLFFTVDSFSKKCEDSKMSHTFCVILLSVTNVYVTLKGEKFYKHS